MMHENLWYNTSKLLGLTEEEAQRRLAVHGPNDFESHHQYRHKTIGAEGRAVGIGTPIVVVLWQSLLNCWTFFRRSQLHSFLQQFLNPLILMLIVSAIVSFFWLDQVADALGRLGQGHSRGKTIITI
jgi:magnesium-transporting ATPase (P-type)